ncbi:hypothetical protein NDN16_10520 [Aureimonas altamirensis]|uniref:hypothetical protein n=1 Tax=Aureimonas altamirensis TaxID=370622 RepID=UPI0020368DA8|nr:hypothetical protein [Aureimonas altamirensis]MCM2504105.1 hypothetical protein [Aureimonas altamirensis]
MALTSAQKQQRFRERQKAKEDAEAAEMATYIRRPFSEFFTEHKDHDWNSSVEEMADHAGLILPNLESEEFKEFEENHLADFEWANRGAMTRAMLLRAAFYEGYRVLTDMLNQYQREEIEARIAEIEAADLSDPAVKKQALGEIVKLNKLLDKLKKTERLSFPYMEHKLLG